MLLLQSQLDASNARTAASDAKLEAALATHRNEVDQWKERVATGVGMAKTALAAVARLTAEVERLDVLYREARLEAAADRRVAHQVNMAGQQMLMGGAIALTGKVMPTASFPAPTIVALGDAAASSAGPQHFAVSAVHADTAPGGHAVQTGKPHAGQRGSVLDDVNRLLEGLLAP